MSEKLSHPFRILIAILLLFALSGCGQERKNLKMLSIVTAVALDEASESGDIVLSVHIIRPSQMRTGKEGGGGGREGAYFIITGKGSTVNEALRQIKQKATKALFFSHNSIVIFGEKLARRGIAPYIDFFNRENEQRRTALLVVAKGKASQLLFAHVNLENTPAQELKDLLDTQRKSEQSPIINFQDYLQASMGSAESSIVPVVELKDEKNKRWFDFTGTSILKAGRLVAFLDREQTKGYQAFKGKAAEDEVRVDIPECQGNFSLKFTNITKKIGTEQSKNGSIAFNVNIETQSIIVEQTCNAPDQSPDLVKALNKSVSDKLQTEILSAVKEAKKHKVDIFGFGEMLEKKQPQKWKTLKRDWDKLFTELEVRVTVKSNVRGSGVIVRPPQKLEEKEEDK